MIKIGKFCRTSQSLFVGDLPLQLRMGHKEERIGQCSLTVFTSKANNEVRASRDFILWYCIAVLCQGCLWPAFCKYLKRILVQGRKLQSIFTNFYAWRNIPVDPELCPIGSLISKRTNVSFHGNSAALTVYYYYVFSGFHSGYWSDNSSLEFDIDVPKTKTHCCQPTVLHGVKTWNITHEYLYAQLMAQQKLAIFSCNKTN